MVNPPSTQQNPRYVKHIELNYKLPYYLLSLYESNVILKKKKKKKKERKKDVYHQLKVHQDSGYPFHIGNSLIYFLNNKIMPLYSSLFLMNYLLKN